MTVRSFLRLSLATAAASLAFVSRPASADIDPAKGAAAFAEAKTICERDGGYLWRYSLCGPVLLIDPVDRAVVGNQRDEGGLLKPSGTVFTGTLPLSENIANTPTEWSGVLWTMLVWPLPNEVDKRHVLFAHEMFHRVQREHGLLQGIRDNSHLDTLEGRYLLQLEWRALAAALRAQGKAERRTAIEDALLFRQERYRLFPDAAAKEAALERNEGLAEYTGVRLGLTSPAARTAFALYDLSAFVMAPSFVRSFAYATGPAYGLLLDDADAGWRDKLSGGGGLDELLSTALSLDAPVLERVQARIPIYDDGTLRGAELERERVRQARLAEWKQLLVDGPVLRVPLDGANRQFNPQTLQPLDRHGAVYPTVRLTARWGILEAEKGALLNFETGTASVGAEGIDASRLSGPGWRLTLNPGWIVEAGSRPGDFIVTKARDGEPNSR